MSKKRVLKEEEPYNPLEKRNIGESIIKAMLEKPEELLPPAQFIGAGVYAIYYHGDNPLYVNNDAQRPIYVGKAVPSGARKGNVGETENQGMVLYNRLKEHAESIESVCNLHLKDFSCRYLAVDDIWIPLAETLLIEMFLPVWNVLVDGFGNHDPGKGRRNQKRSAWDVIHYGRKWADDLKPNKLTKHQIEAKIIEFLAKETPNI